MLTKKSPKVAKIFSCKFCNYVSSKKSDFNKHKSTLKHCQFTTVNTKLTDKLSLHTCSTCNKTYKSRVGLWKHNKVCISISHQNNTIIKEDNDVSQLTSLVIEVVKNNSEFQKQMMDMCKNMQSSIITNCNNITTNNNTFNLQVFLNEHCKDAMNINEFIDSFDLQISDLENVGRLGYVEGMSTIIINKIKELDVNKRPIHCSDLKREIIYIKEDDIWEREDSNNTKFRKVIKKVTGKNIGMLSDWRDKYPDCTDI